MMNDESKSGTGNQPRVPQSRRAILARFPKVDAASCRVSSAFMETGKCGEMRGNAARCRVYFGVYFGSHEAYVYFGRKLWE